MGKTVSVSLAQLNPIVGDIEGNAALIRNARNQASYSDLMITSELVICGYPPQDLLLRSSFLTAVEAAVYSLAAETSDGGTAMLLGAPWREDGQLYNAALLLSEGKIVARRYKHDLPNYSVFDEKRLFTPGALAGPMAFRGVRIGVLLCEDLWGSEVAECLSESGADMFVVLNGSPYEAGKHDERLCHAVARVRENHLPLIYVNQVGAQDELVFDGASFILSAKGELRAALPAWQERVEDSQWHKGSRGWECKKAAIAPQESEEATLYAALTLGLRDYVKKSRLSTILIGLSGGIDSALAAVLAVDALGAENVTGVMMPSPYTSQASLEDATEIANRLGIPLHEIDIAPVMELFTDILAPVIGDHPPDVTEENIQSRARGMILMALSNKWGGMLLATGNKSEMSVGYTTLYGDMCGGFAILKDVYKTTILALADWRNREILPWGSGPSGEVIPSRVITRPPSAELKPEQVDEDCLPPYSDLDAILTLLIEQDCSPDEVVKAGYESETVHGIWRMILASEYKRQQAPPGVKVSRRVHGKERRYPIINHFIPG